MTKEQEFAELRDFKDKYQAAMHQGMMPTSKTFAIALRRGFELGRAFEAQENQNNLAAVLQQRAEGIR